MHSVLYGNNMLVPMCEANLTGTMSVLVLNVFLICMDLTQSMLLIYLAVLGIWAGQFRMMQKMTRKGIRNQNKHKRT